MLIKQREIDILSKWSIEATERIHASTLKYLLIRTEKGLISTNFDENVSMFCIKLATKTTTTTTNSLRKLKDMSNIMGKVSPCGAKLEI